mgnify:CR=1 FL=1
MANDDFARGFVPLNTNGKGTVDSHYYLATTVTDISIGMPLRLLSGRVQRAAVTGMASVIGVALGFSRNKGGPNELAPWLDVSGLTSDDWYVQVADDPTQEFYIQEDTGGTALTATAGYYFINGIYQTTSIDTVTGITRLELDASTALANTSGMCRVLRLHDAVNSDGTQNAVGDYAKWVVVFGFHQKSSVAMDVA